MDIVSIISIIFNSILSLFLSINLFLDKIVKISEKISKNEEKRKKGE